jgi:hypothetical protein
MTLETLTETSIEVSLYDLASKKRVRGLRPAPKIQTEFGTKEAWLAYVDRINIERGENPEESRRISVFENGRVREELSDGSLAYYSRNENGNIDGLLKHYENFGGFIADNRKDLPDGRFDIGDHAYEEFNDIVEKRFYLREKIFYNNGLRQGMYKQYVYKNGYLCELNERSNYLKGELHGIQYIFDKDGKAESIKFFIKGENVTKAQWERYKEGPKKQVFKRTGDTENK